MVAQNTNESTTKFDICSKALTMIGANTISSFDDGTTESDIASQLYEDTLRALLTQHRWRFSTQQVQLSRLENTPHGRWDAGYQIPADCILIHAITVNDNLVKYERYGDKIYCNLDSTSTVIMDYTFRQEEDQFPPFFTITLQYKLASLFGASIARDPNLVQSFNVLFNTQVRIARSIGSQERTNKRLGVDRYLAFRKSTRSPD